ncbi:hypothetical protein ACIQWL_44410 [Streptomyces mirabilis]|uniref:hypothetical protein n=1 Tax=Streptomyces mirabilis TaxID=68239 RepID=UPI003819600F
MDATAARRNGVLLTVRALGDPLGPLPVVVRPHARAGELVDQVPPCAPGGRGDPEPGVGLLGRGLGEEHVAAAVRLRRRQSGPAQGVGHERCHGAGGTVERVPPGDGAPGGQPQRAAYRLLRDCHTAPGAVEESGKGGVGTLERGHLGGGALAQFDQGGGVRGQQPLTDVVGRVPRGGLGLALAGARAGQGRNRDRLDLDPVRGGLLGQNRGDGDPGPGAVGGEFQGAASA